MQVDVIVIPHLSFPCDKINHDEVLLNDQHRALGIKKKKKSHICSQIERKKKMALVVETCSMAVWTLVIGCLFLLFGLQAPAGYIQYQRALWARHGGKCA